MVVEVKALAVLGAVIVVVKAVAVLTLATRTFVPGACYDPSTTTAVVHSLIAMIVFAIVYCCNNSYCYNCYYCCYCY